MSSDPGGRPASTRGSSGNSESISAGVSSSAAGTRTEDEDSSARELTEEDAFGRELSGASSTAMRTISGDSAYSEYSYASSSAAGENFVDTKPSWYDERIRLKRWEDKDAELRAAMARSDGEEVRLKLCDRSAGGLRSMAVSGEKSTTTDGSTDSQKPQQQQFFSDAKSSFQVLSKDLLAIQRVGEEALGFTAEAVDDNIYHWRVLFTRFANVGLNCSNEDAASLQSDLVALERRFAYRSVELEVRFTIDLYPFFPPQVKLVRPRFDGGIFLRIAQLDCLRLSNWNPVGGMEYVLRSVQRTIASGGRIALDHDENDPWLSPEGAYTELDHQLMRLGMLTEVPPREAQPVVGGTHSVVGQSSAATREGGTDDAAAGNKTFWAKGTGYGHGGTGGWDVDAYIAAEKEKDRLIADVLSRIGILLMPPNGLGTADDDVAMPSTDEDEADEVEAQRLRVAQGSGPALSASCLLPVLAVHLENESLVDMSRHARLYVAVMRLCRTFAAWPHLAFLLGEGVDGNSNSSSTRGRRTLLGLLGALAHRVAIAHNAEQRATAEGDESTEEMDPTQWRTAGMIRETSADAERSLLGLIALTHAEAVAAATSASPSEATAPASPTAAAGRDAREEAESSESQYCSVMGPLQYDEAEVLSGYHFSSSAAGGGQTSTFLRRLAREHADLSQSLPLTESSSCWMRVDANRMDCVQFLLSAPEDTPYSGGLFLFDAFFPARYPEGPPQVNLQTTGGGRVRFNPNLYNCGKVCLSLLGTWEGETGETWNAKTSTFLQVVVSIQSLILVPQPYYNEPGYEAEMGTPRGDANSASYNANIRVQTLRYAMIGMLRSPPAGLEDVVRIHFELRGAFLVAQIEVWIDEERRLCLGTGFEGGAQLREPTELVSLLGEFKAELSKLPAAGFTIGKKGS